MKYSFWTALLFFVMIGLLVIACGEGEPAEQDETPVEAEVEVVEQEEYAETPAEVPVTWDFDISSDYTLKNIAIDPEVVDYVVSEVIDVDANLTIEPGVRIQFASGTRLDINKDGVLSAVGTEVNQIIFEGQVAVTGYWDGILIASNNPLNELTHAEVAHGGANDYANIFVTGDGQLKITNSISRQSATEGLIANGGARLSGFAGNSFLENTGAAIKIPANLIGSLDAASTYAGSNGREYIDVTSQWDPVSTAQTWPAMDVPYHFNEVVDIDASIEIGAGADFLFASGARIDVNRAGALVAVGTAEAPITFMGDAEIAGYWDGIWIDSNNPLNELTHVEVAHGGANDLANIFVTEDGQLRITNSILRQSATEGLIANGGARLPGFAGNSFLENNGAAIMVPADLIGSLDAVSTYAGSNGREYIDVTSQWDPVSTAQTWPAMDVPYHFKEVVDIDASIEIGAGADFLFASGARVDVNSAGALVAVGTAEAPITFLGDAATAGYWDGICIDSNNPLNELTHVEVAHGGANNFANIYVTEDGQLKITNSYIHDSAVCGIEILAGAQYTIESNTYAGNAGGDECLPD